jgi:uncharacterized membrane protein YedE/YeeE
MEHPSITVIAGAIFGAGAGVLLLVNGRIAGFSGIAAGIVGPRRGDVAWRLSFVAGVFAGGALGALVYPESIARVSMSSPVALVAAGLLIGVGARLANGCTSGHGICGVGRLSVRSLVAVAVFTLSGIVAYALRVRLAGIGS